MHGGVGAICGYTVMYIQDEEQGAEDTALWESVVENLGGLRCNCSLRPPEVYWTGSQSRHGVVLVLSAWSGDWEGLWY